MNVAFRSEAVSFCECAIGRALRLVLLAGGGAGLEVSTRFVSGVFGTGQRW